MSPRSVPMLEGVHHRTRLGETELCLELVSLNRPGHVMVLRQEDAAESAGGDGTMQWVASFECSESP